MISWRELKERTFSKEELKEIDKKVKEDLKKINGKYYYLKILGTPLYSIIAHRNGQCFSTSIDDAQAWKSKKAATLEKNNIEACTGFTILVCRL